MTIERRLLPKQIKTLFESGERIALYCYDGSTDTEWFEPITSIKRRRSIGRTYYEVRLANGREVAYESNERTTAEIGGR